MSRPHILIYTSNTLISMRENKIHKRIHPKLLRAKQNYSDDYHNEQNYLQCFIVFEFHIIMVSFLHKDCPCEEIFFDKNLINLLAQDLKLKRYEALNPSKVKIEFNSKLYFFAKKASNKKITEL